MYLKLFSIYVVFLLGRSTKLESVDTTGKVLVELGLIQATATEKIHIISKKKKTFSGVVYKCVLM